MFDSNVCEIYARKKPVAENVKGAVLFFKANNGNKYTHQWLDQQNIHLIIRASQDLSYITYCTTYACHPETSLVNSHCTQYF